MDYFCQTSVQFSTNYHLGSQCVDAPDRAEQDGSAARDKPQDQANQCDGGGGWFGSSEPQTQLVCLVLGEI